MVWNSTQSALYRAIDRHNDGGDEGGFRREKFTEKNGGKCGEKNRRENAPKNGGKFARAETKNRCENCPKNRPHDPPPDPVSRIMSDGDMLLIAGLIFVLMRENADKALILALVIVLLG
ncbi:MAG: hypothetical protein HDT43_12300 [Ruminococcaceae bacterium]|nr:hypothetical protein [Oscillospiraceae bacterium]